MNPLRKYYFWDSEIHKSAKDLKKMQDFGRVILEAYRGNKFDFDSETHDKTIMSHIMRHDYPSEEHRISDVLVFLIAGSPLFSLLPLSS
jgi:hypothetical protein